MGRPTYENGDGVTVLRLLPWPSPEGKPCYLVPDAERGHLSRLADRVEVTLLGAGADVLARGILDNPAAPYIEVRNSGLRLAECLADALCIAEFRGQRLRPPAPAVGEGAGTWPRR
ncbi:hypothetical protein [Streptomyces sp. NRRL S-1868]|uniref:hypothetical protein n=1 Tax=Streptomyces sp. NRRL S-1868 TaxID=1463892 RepID=UPI00068BEBA6|nr:hypothetical protein [Streptomyces sp. NRRL S-1868]